MCWNQVGYDEQILLKAAAFGRLCVETFHPPLLKYISKSRSRLRAAVCWNLIPSASLSRMRAAAFGRLCVETGCIRCNLFVGGGSRLRAAVCWNSGDVVIGNEKCAQPPSGGCVLKQNELNPTYWYIGSSRLRAAVCWNSNLPPSPFKDCSSRLRAAVCWNKLLLW